MKWFVKLCKMSVHGYHMHETSTGLPSSVWILCVEGPGSASPRFLLWGLVSGGYSWLFKQWWLHRCSSWIWICLGMVMANSGLFTDFMRTLHWPSDEQGNIPFVSCVPHRFPGKFQNSTPGQASQPAPITLDLGFPADGEQPALGVLWKASRRNS